MPEVSVEINGRKYRMACEEGQEDHLKSLAAKFNQQVEMFKGSFGEIGDNRLTVMAGIAVLDEMEEIKRQLAEVKNSVSAIEAERDGAIETARKLEQDFTRKLSDTARRIEVVAQAINETGS